MPEVGLVLLGVIFLGAGLAKLLGAAPIKANFALATHARVRDPLQEWMPAIATTVAAVAVLATA